ncbi:hypothetical protein [Actinacidiphila guanduensis]|uniref:Putative drug exporter of the RND superfamily n=1 Tax=Actinacidiphila guanduensis TaxID=310781 RepID=A0A1H0Q2A5_9ACTN|nr:hypothetical protein [Actinacidiphila guanduensis]SDP11155.1 putative drug exporter of the RND superfamily [Actinacidiphila guanduensis]
MARGPTGHGGSEVSVHAQDPPGSAGETTTLDALRAVLPHGTYVGGPSAQQLDTQATDA